MKAQRGDVLRSPKRVRWHRRRKDSTPHPNFLTKEILWAEHARFRGKQTLNQRAGTLMLAKVCVTSPEIQVDGFRRAELCHHVEARGRVARLHPNIPANHTLQENASICTSEHKTTFQQPLRIIRKRVCVLRNERAGSPALSSDRAAIRANLEAAGGAL